MDDMDKSNSCTQNEIHDTTITTYHIFFVIKKLKQSLSSVFSNAMRYHKYA